ncbi:hypothetical protein [Streptomyces sp. NPDC089919]|uniref:hypothetical protein n=1 Tax=Streptomyces sp. NPDC089919 TaxID=3155188 RepID=UPI00341D1BFB
MDNFRFLDEVSALLAARYGRWTCGWEWSVHNGGPVGAWCCDAHSIGGPQETAARVAACLLEWRDWLEYLAERFDDLAPPPGSTGEDRSWHVERAATRLVTTVIDRTGTAGGWYGLCTTTLTWYVTSTGLAPQEAAAAVRAAIGGRFESWTEPAPALVESVGEDLAVRLTGCRFFRER